VYLHSHFFLVGSENASFLSVRVRVGRSRSSEVIDVSTTRKPVCGFLSRHSNLRPILFRLRDKLIADFLLRIWPPPVFYRNFGMVPLDQIAHANIRISPSQNLKLMRRETFFRSIPTCVNVTDRQADGRTDGQMDDILQHNRAVRSIAR